MHCLEIIIARNVDQSIKEGIEEPEKAAAIAAAMASDEWARNYAVQCLLRRTGGVK